MPLVPLGVRELCCALRARQDLVVGNSGGANEVYRNEGGGTVTAVTGSPITSGSASTRAVAWGDMDGDGDLVRRRRSEREAGRNPMMLRRRGLFGRVGRHASNGRAYMYEKCRPLF